MKAPLRGEIALPLHIFSGTDRRPGLRQCLRQCLRTWLAGVVPKERFRPMSDSPDAVSTVRCASCGTRGCAGPSGEYPTICPTAHPSAAQIAVLAEARERYDDGRVRKTAQTAAWVEKAGYCRWTRLGETAEFARRMGYRRIGIASCSGLRREALVVTRFLEQCGFEVQAVICKAGAVPKEHVGVPAEAQFRPGALESMCNPVGQAYLLAAAGCDFNVVLGLCVGHDTLFLEHSFRKGVPATVLVAKDRVTGHSPCAAIYGAEGYFQARLAEHHQANTGTGPLHKGEKA